MPPAKNLLSFLINAYFIFVPFIRYSFPFLTLITIPRLCTAKPRSRMSSQFTEIQDIGLKVQETWLVLIIKTIRRSVLTATISWEKAIQKIENWPRYVYQIVYHFESMNFSMVIRKNSGITECVEQKSKAWPSEGSRGSVPPFPWVLRVRTCMLSQPFTVIRV